MKNHAATSFLLLLFYLLMLDLLSINHHPGLLVFSKLFLRDAPVATASAFFLTTLRSALAYGLLLFPFWKLLGLWLSPSRVFLFIAGLYPLLALMTATHSPMLFELLDFPRLVGLLSFSLVAGSVFFLKHLKSKRGKENRPFEVFFYATGILFLVLTVPASWQSDSSLVQEKPLPSHTSRAPDILWIGLDGLVPEDFNQLRQVQSFLSQNRAFQTSALSPANSTYVSWMSLLTGLLPEENGIVDFFPRQRITPHPTLAHRLQKLGYRTVFMTDCGSTAFQSPEHGFSQIYQNDRGSLACGRGLLTSTHFLNYWLPRALFPELQSFCSAGYKPALYWQQVQHILQAPQPRPPLFVATHSCLTHPGVLSHYKTQGLPPVHRHPLSLNQKKEYFPSTLRTQDALLGDFLKSIPKERTEIFIFSDHGRTPHAPNPFGHGMGLKPSINQYRVPLVYLGSQKAQFQVSSPSSLSTRSLFPWTLALAMGDEKALQDPLLASSLHRSYPFDDGSAFSKAAMTSQGILYLP